ncbi:MAG: hypothetical protein ABEH65_06000 [Halobacteriales archaeon]
MIVADTSALISLATADIFDIVLVEFDVHTTDTVIEELEDTASFDDVHGAGAQQALNRQDQLTVHTVEEGFTSSRVDTGEGSCCALADDIDAVFLITDDLRALPELQRLTDANVAISPIVLKALVTRGVLDRDDALARLERLAGTRDWLGAPIYRRARRLFDE